MRVTDKQIAEEFGVTPQTLQNYKNGTKQKQRLYNVMLNAIIEQDMLIWEVHKENGSSELINNAIIGHYLATNLDVKLVERYEVK